MVQPTGRSWFLYDEAVEAPVRSLRNSHHGYVNEEHVHVSFSQLESYVLTSRFMRQVLVTSVQEKEFTSPCTLSRAKTKSRLPRTRHYLLELRCFDLNPFDVLGIVPTKLGHSPSLSWLYCGWMM